MAYLGRKQSCGCPVFARLCEYKPKRNMPNLRIERVPVEQADVSICRCDD